MFNVYISCANNIWAQCVCAPTLNPVILRANNYYYMYNFVSTRTLRGVVKKMLSLSIQTSSKTTCYFSLAHI